MAANRNFHNMKGSLTRGVVYLYAKATIGGTGAVASFSGPGIAAFARTGAGAYRITLSDNYTSLLCPSIEFLAASSVDLNPQLVAETVSTTKFVDFVMLAVAAPTDPASGTQIFVELALKNSSVLP